MGFLGDVISWFNDRANWRGPSGVIVRVSEHTQVSVATILVAMVFALPVAIWLGHKRRYGNLAVNISNIGRALPSFAILAVGSQILGTREVPVIMTTTTFLALIALAIPPIVTNAYVGMAEVPDEVRDAARGMGLSDRQVLFTVELPLAVPLIMAGVRTSSVQVVATATIAAVVGGGGLGRFIIDGFAVQDNVQVTAGAALVALLSLTTEVGLSGVQRLVTPAGLRRTRKVPKIAETAPVDPAVQIA
ncbi:MAG: ABC transporter permease [Acidimicrobiales bacterium]